MKLVALARSNAGGLRVTAIILAFTSFTWAQTPRRSATLEQQKMCADRARKVDDLARQGTSPDPNTIHYITSHYNVAQNVCYVISHTKVSEKDRITTYTDISDAFEGKQRAWYMSMRSDLHGLLNCKLTPANGGELKCVSEDDFKRQATKLYGIEW